MGEAVEKVTDAQVDAALKVLIERDYKFWRSTPRADQVIEHFRQTARAMLESAQNVVDGG